MYDQALCSPRGVILAQPRGWELRERAGRAPAAPQGRKELEAGRNGGLAGLGRLRPPYYWARGADCLTRASFICSAGHTCGWIRG